MPDKIVKDLSIDEKERVVYAKLRRRASDVFDKIASGSSRDVYDAGKYVVKVAKNAKGIDQNRKEYEVSSDGYYDDIIAKVIYTAENLSFIIMERAQKIKGEADFRNKAGFGMTYLEWVIIDRFRPRNFGYKPEPKERDKPQNEEAEEIVNEITSYIADYSIIKSYNDILRPSSWGYLDDGSVVLIDYGLDDYILQTHYIRNI